MYPDWINKIENSGFAINVGEAPEWFMEYFYYQDIIKRKSAIGFAHWLDEGPYISVTFGGNPIIHGIEEKYELYLESLKK
jgi:hypothetical protein